MGIAVRATHSTQSLAIDSYLSALHLCTRVVAVTMNSIEAGHRHHNGNDTDRPLLESDHTL